MTDDKTLFWHTFWKEQGPLWHSTEVSSQLIQHFEELTQGKKDATILVPLCGKSVDLIWLYEQGYHVIGIDAVEKAAIDFFKEHNLSYTKDTCDKNGAIIYKTEDNKLEFWVCDFFTITAGCFSPVDAVWDIGSLFAINPKDRGEYVDIMQTLLSRDYCYLLESVTYKSQVFAGPPYPLWPDEVHKLFDPWSFVELLDCNEHDECEDCQDRPRTVSELHNLTYEQQIQTLTHMCHYVYLMRPYSTMQ